MLKYLLKRRHINIALALLLFSTVANSQGWNWRNPLPQKNNTYCTWFIDANTGFLVGKYGTLMRTKDGGATWEFYYCSTSSHLQAVTFAGDLTGYAGGEGGILLKTTNGGNSWFTIKCSHDQDIYKSICFVSPDTGFVASGYGTVYRTTDGGITWTPKKLGSNLYCVRFFDSDNGIITSGYNSPIYLTDDGGITWDTIQLNTEPLGCAYASADIILASGSVMKRSVDRGITWTTVTGGPGGMRSIHFTDEMTGYAAGFGGKIFKTTDAGLTWQPQLNTGADADALFSIHGVGETGYAAGAGTRYPSFYKTTNGGNDWLALASTKTITYLNDFTFSDANTAFCVGYARILKTTDHGENWSIVDSTDAANLSVDFTSPTTGYIAGYAFEIDSLTGFITASGFIKKTTDGGQTWQKITIGTSIPIYSIDFATPNLGVAVGYDASGEGNGYILRTTDAGATWTMQIPSDVTILNKVIFVDSFTGYIVGGTMEFSSLHGNILKTNDGGLTWNNSWTQHLLEDINFPVPGTGYAGGPSSFMKTENSGKDWEEVEQTEILRTMSLYFFNADTGFSAGWQGRIYKTTDGGLSWTKQWSKTGEDLYVITFTDENTGFVAGQGGVLLKTTDGGGIPVGIKDIPLISIKLNAFPNPSSGMVTIETIANAHLGVYSITGKLMLSHNPQGRLAKLDLSGLQAGLYIIRQQNENTVAISKIIKQ